MMSSLDWFRVQRLAEIKPWTIGFALAAYRQATDIEDSDLAAYLGCTREDLGRIAACRRPVDQGALLGSAEALAAEFKIPPEKLIAVLRLADAVDALRDAGDPDVALRAARDRKPPDTDT